MAWHRYVLGHLQANDDKIMVSYIRDRYLEGWMSLGLISHINTLRSRQNGRHFADDTFKYIFLNENVIISAKISLKFVPEGPINNIPALVQIMAWRRPGDKPLSEPVIVSLLTHICVSRLQWVNMQHSPVPLIRLASTGLPTITEFQY